MSSNVAVVEDSARVESRLEKRGEGKGVRGFGRDWQDWWIGKSGWREQRAEKKKGDQRGVVRCRWRNQGRKEESDDMHIPLSHAKRISDKDGSGTGRQAGH